MTVSDTTVPVASASRTASIAATAFAAVIGGVAAGIVLALRIAKGGDESPGHNWWVVAWLVIGIIDTVIGAALVTRYGHRRLGGCFLVVGVAALLLAVARQSGFAADIDPETAWADLEGAGDWAHPIATGVLAALIPWELAKSARRPTIEAIWWATAGLIAADAVGTAAGMGRPAIEVLRWMVAVSATVATIRLIVMWWNRRGNDDPLPLWLAAGSLAAWLAVVPEELEVGFQVPLGDVAGSLVLLATVPLLVVAAIVAALRERSGRLQGIIAHDVIAWLVLTGTVMIVYTAFVAGVGDLVGGEGPTWLLVAATGLVALIIEPARRWSRFAVDRLVWGARDDPLEVVRGVVEHVGADSGDELLPALAESLQRDLRLDAVAIDVRTPDGWRREAALGPKTTYERVIELDQHGEVVGRLLVGWEYGPALRARDEHVLAELVGPLGLAVGWVRLAADLRRSSVAIVSAREEERRRLRRDLHDGLGPALTGVSLGLRTALRQLERTPDPDALLPSRQLLTRAADEVDSIVLEVKRIVRDLRPTALDQLGLVDAVVEFTRTFEDELDIQLSMPDGRLELPAAVEVATYRIVMEAVTNVVRHARAARCWLSISTGTTIDIDVIDDGIGLDGGVRNGVGLTAMRERAEELGGTVLVEPHRPHGTHVHVRLPAVLP
jgi:signal transduction histidine kinase